VRLGKLPWATLKERWISCITVIKTKKKPGASSPGFFLVFDSFEILVVATSVAPDEILVVATSVALFFFVWEKHKRLKPSLQWIVDLLNLLHFDSFEILVIANSVALFFPLEKNINSGSRHYNGPELIEFDAFLIVRNYLLKQF
jgi:hypothetical protein